MRNLILILFKLRLLLTLPVRLFNEQRTQKESQNANLYRLQFDKKIPNYYKLHEGLRVSRLFYLHALQNGITFR